jgi:hypothetical protein
MSNGHEEKEMVYITMDPEEFNRVCRRLNEMLSSRVSKAWSKRNRLKTERAEQNHVEAAKDAYAFIHLLQLIEHMSEEICELRSELESLPDGEFEDEFEVASQPRGKVYMN